MLAVAAVVLFQGRGGVARNHIPDSFLPDSGLIGDFAVADLLQVSYTNYTAVRHVNSTALPSGVYLSFHDPHLDIMAASLRVRVTVVTSAPNATVDVTMLDPGSFALAKGAFEGSNLTRAAHDGSVLYSAFEYSFGSPRHVWVVPIAGTTAFASSEGAEDAKSALEIMLDVKFGALPSALTRSDVQRMLYVVNGSDSHLAFAIQEYPGAVTSGLATLIAVDKTGPSLEILQAVTFANATLADSQLHYFQTVYLGYEKFSTYDEILLAGQTQPVSSLTKAIAATG